MNPPSARAAASAGLPLSVRARLDHEILADLEGAYETLRARGWPHEGALERAQRMVVPDAAALEGLAAVHRPLYQVLAARFSPTAVHRGERAALVGVALATLGLLARLLSASDLFARPSAFLVPVLVLGAAGVAAVAGKAFHLFVKRDPDPDRLSRGLAAIVALATATALVGAVGALVETYRFAGSVGVVAPSGAGPVVAFLGSTAALLAVASGLALAVGLGWFVLLQWAARAEVRARHPLHPPSFTPREGLHSPETIP